MSKGMLGPDQRLQDLDQLNATLRDAMRMLSPDAGEALLGVLENREEPKEGSKEILDASEGFILFLAEVKFKELVNDILVEIEK